VCGAQIFIKMDVRNTHQRVLIKEGDEYQTAFHTRCIQFGYGVMPIRFTNAPATLQAGIDDCLRPYIDDLAVHYQHDIVIYMTSEKEHEHHVKKEPELLQQCGLYWKAESANSEPERLASSDFSSVLTGLAWNETAYQPSRTGLLPTQSEKFKHC